MQRGTALFLLATGLFLAVVGVLVGGVALGVFQSGVRPDLSAGLICGLGPLLLGLALVLLSLAVVRGTKPSDLAPPSGGYRPNEQEERTLGGRVYRLHYTPGYKGHPPTLAVRFKARSPVPLRLDPESWFDRLCKWAGLAVEHQTGDRDFDDAVYVRCASPEVARRFLADPARRAAALALLRVGFTSVEFDGGDAVAYWANFDTAAHPHPGPADEAAGHLMRLADGLPGPDPDKVAARGDPGLVNAVFLWLGAGLYAALFVAAFVAPPVRIAPLLWAALALYVPLYLGFGWVAAWLLRGAATSHDRWAALMCGALFLLAGGSVGAVAAVNSGFDGGAVQGRGGVVTGKRVSGGRSRSYHASVPAWDGGGVIDFSVSRSEYDNITAGRSRIELTTGPGLLGIEWIRSRRVVP